jgi:hypothetical protein
MFLRHKKRPTTTAFAREQFEKKSVFALRMQSEKRRFDFLFLFIGLFIISSD